MTERCILGVPHSSTRDDIYKGFFIPKGTVHSALLRCFRYLPGLKGSIVIANAWFVGCLFFYIPI